MLGVFGPNTVHMIAPLDPIAPCMKQAEAPHHHLLGVALSLILYNEQGRRSNCESMNVPMPIVASDSPPTTQVSSVLDGGGGGVHWDPHPRPSYEEKQKRVTENIRSSSGLGH